MDEIWLPKWAAAHGGEDYSPGKHDYREMAEILTRLGSKKDEHHAIERFAKIADVALEREESFGWEGHRLAIVQKHLSALIGDTAKKLKGLGHVNGNTNRNRTAAPATISEGLKL